MYLKTLYIQGFKSFANKTKLEFNNKITGIVGPNGSGKSNISDAIMWVLGETSVKSLRGSKMEDVIFSGTDKRKPLGLAEVTIVFDNSDGSLPIEYNEVSVTRRMYRSLESEFLINNVKCRLKDIKELFMDTGIGKDGYSLIGQGRIESILSSKPEQRRAIFEEAAGISKFKMRKTESERKLQKTKENLIRLNDIISEIKKRSILLEEQSKKAIEYKELFKKLKDLEMSIAYKDISKNKSDIEKIKIELKNNEIELKKRKESVEKINNELENSIEKIDCLNKELSKFQEKEVVFNREYENINSKINIYNEKINNNNLNIKTYKNSIEKIGEKNISFEEEVKYLEDEIKILKEDKNIVEKNIKVLEEELDKVKTDLNFEEKQQSENDNNYLSIHKKVTDLESKISMTVTLLEEKSKRINSIDSNLNLLLTNDKELEESINKTKEKFEDFKKENQELLDQQTIKNNYLIELKKQEKKLSEELNLIKNNFEEERAKYNAIKNLADNYEGYSKSVKSFMNFTKKRNLFADTLLGTVADKIKVESQYEKAISVALGGSIQNIIIEKEQDAKEMIALLIKEKLGRVTFLPINSIRSFNNKINLDNYKNKDVLGFADELIEYDIKFKDIFKNLLGKIIVTRNFDSAVELSKKLNRSYRIVTLDGDSLNIGGSISGGNVYKGIISILGRETELIDLESSVNNLKNKYNDLLENYNNNNSKIKELDFTTSTILSKLNENSRNLIGAENEINSLKNSKKTNQDYIDKYLLEKNSLKESSEKDYSDVEKYNLEKDELEEREKEILKSKLDYKSRLDDLNTYVNDKNEELSKIKLEYFKINTDIESKLRDISAKRDYITKNNSEILELDELINSLKEDLEKLDNSIKLKNNELNNKSEEIEELLQTIDDLKNNQITENKKLNELRIELDENKEIVNELEKTADKKAFMIDKLKYDIDNILNKLINNYDIVKEEVQETIKIESLKDAKQNIKNLKQKISSLGEINILSIDEYEEVKERLEFNITQKQDLIDSIDEINSILLELDKEMKEKFEKSFKEISVHFNDIFKILFNGGRAEIEIEGEDSLLGGVEIKAQPPGKRFQSLSLLSGGERALTAVALLFALLKVRPAPFCILDEIDAALDDANIKRYTDYLLTLDDIQFIMITHRKSTMEIANKLYGVTMEEKGISKLISVELTK